MAASTKRSTTAAERRRRALSPFLLAYAVNPVALAAYWLLRRWDLVADKPLWVYLVILWGGATFGTAAEQWYTRRPGTFSLHARVLVQNAAVTAAIYVTGWGPAAALLYGFMAQENIARSGARTWRITAFWSLASLTAGQVAIWQGWAPSLLEDRYVHGLAAINAIGVIFVVRMAAAVTEQKEGAEAALRISEDRFRSLVQNSSDLTLVIDAYGTVTYASAASTRLLGRAPEDLVGEAAASLVHPADLEPLRAELRAKRAREIGQPVEFRAVTGAGDWRHLEAVVVNLVDRPSVNGTVVNARDITERKRAEAALEHQALHDALTGLPNRTLLLERLESAIARAADELEKPAVIFFDLDRFKLVNDGLGHDVGDELLALVAERVRTGMRPSDTVARLGGDEFVLLCEGVSNLAAARALGDRVLSCFDQPFVIHGEEFKMSASIGVAMLDGGGASELVRHADEAMYRAKANGRGQVRLFDESVRDEALLRMHTETGLRRALEGGELRVHYQPIYDLQSMHAIGVEALLRWEHPTGGLLTPDDFMDVAEDSGLIVPIGEWVLREACRQVRDWNDRRPTGAPLSLSVNLSARQLADPNLVQMVTDVLATAGVDAHSLQLALEVTETLMLRDPETAAAWIAQLRELGVSFAIDDFGTGYSSLSYLRRFPVSIVKIDRAFVEGLGASVEDEAIVRAVVQLGRTLDMSVIAEGVETEQQLRRLREIGCHRAQGFLLGRPQSAADLELTCASGTRPGDIPLVSAART